MHSTRRARVTQHRYRYIAVLHTEEMPGVEQVQSRVYLLFDIRSRLAIVQRQYLLYPPRGASPVSTSTLCIIFAGLGARVVSQ